MTTVITIVSILRDTNSSLNVQPFGGSVKHTKSLLQSLSAPVNQSPALKELQESDVSVFIQRSVPAPMEDLLTLKRVTPITEEDDNEELMESPTKRSRMTLYEPVSQELLDRVDSSVSQILSWNAQVLESSITGFALSLDQ